MKAVILAAGTSSRLRPLTDDLPKCLLEVGGTALLGRTIEALDSRGVSRIVLVTGFREEMIRDYLAGHFPGLSVEFVSNPRYTTTNNIVSLWLARPLVGSDEMLLLDSDIFFDRRIIDTLLSSPHTDRLAVTTGRPLGGEEIKVRVDSEGFVVEIGKHVHPRNAMGESIGIELFGREFVRELFVELERMVEQENQAGVFYEAAFQRVIDRGRRVYAVDTADLPCLEIDTLEDLLAARALVTPPEG
jgi:choline kinase